jgi:trehalose synthase
VKRIEDYRGIVEDEILADLHRRASRLFDTRVVHVNSTAYGGGVAELLSSVVPLMNDAGVTTGWRVLVGSNDFFKVTKKFHNALQGEDIQLTDQKKRLYLSTNESFSQYTHLERAGAMIIHDPQPLPIISFYRKRQPWIWRCHIDLSSPNRELWEYLKGYVLRYDLVVVSHESYLRPDLPVRQMVVHPAIDPLSEKNVHLEDDKIAEFLAESCIPLDKPLVTQVSRFDRHKDPVGVVECFKLARQNVDCRLVLAGNVAIDDPEGAEVLAEVRAAAGDLVDSGDVVLLNGASDVTINALQRASRVVLQKSTREGFGLTVAEAMWKRVPVIASAVGGIPLQVSDGENGYLVDPYDFNMTAARIVDLVENRDRALDMGVAGREHIRCNFLTTRLVGHWLALIKEVIDESRC